MFAKMSSLLRPVITTIFLTVFLSACGGSGGDTPPNDPPALLPDPDPIPIPIPDPDPDPDPVPGPVGQDNFDFRVGQEYALETNETFVGFIESEIGGSVAPMNQIDNIFGDVTVPVTYQECGVVNAFYSPATREIFICDELTADSYFFFLGEGTTDEEMGDALGLAIAAVTFVMYHEMGHALDDLRDLGVGGNFESVADAIGVVLSVQTGQPFAALFGAAILESGEASFGGVHGSGPDRAGDIVCWMIGSSSRVSALVPELAAIYNDIGRDCVAEYFNQFDFVERLVPGLRSVPPKGALRGKPTQAQLDQYAEIDKRLAAKLKLL